MLSNILAMWKCIKLIWALVHHKDKDNFKILAEFNKAQAKKHINLAKKDVLLRQRGKSCFFSDSGFCFLVMVAFVNHINLVPTLHTVWIEFINNWYDDLCLLFNTIYEFQTT